jgi:DNA-binding NarL/FixJ family response regulator
MNVVGEADDGDTALEQARLLQPDVILMDVQMPKMSGITATHYMTTIAPSSAIILLSLSDEDHMRRMAMSAGASAFLTKHSQTDPLISIVRQLSADR